MHGPLVDRRLKLGTTMIEIYATPEELSCDAPPSFMLGELTINVEPSEDGDDMWRIYDDDYEIDFSTDRWCDIVDFEMPFWGVVLEILDQDERMLELSTASMIKVLKGKQLWYEKRIPLAKKSIEHLQSQLFRTMAELNKLHREVPSDPHVAELEKILMS